MTSFLSHDALHFSIWEMLARLHFPYRVVSRLRRFFFWDNIQWTPVRHTRAVDSFDSAGDIKTNFQLPMPPHDISLLPVDVAECCCRILLGAFSRRSLSRRVISRECGRHSSGSGFHYSFRVSTVRFVLCVKLVPGGLRTRAWPTTTRQKKKV